uniref:CCHC-type domain-containing protein n=1 Tax=Tanacetum cinerariifolium TaxID=118510 RepID=A0A6L2KB32_TANCI|nr:hypothetical protein [Tanacetum cinerariifolium]
MDSLSPQVVSAAKLPILNPNEFDLWKMRIEQYFLMTDYSLWELILNGDSSVPIRIIEGILQPVASTTVEQKLARKNELKARGTLLMALPDKHQLKFNSYKDAKTLVEAIEKRFGGNTETNKVQKTLLKQQYENFIGSHLESLDQIHDRLQKLTHTLIWRNKADLEEQSLDDLFNSLKIYEAKVKHSSSTDITTQNLAFVSSSNTDITTESLSAAASVFAVYAKMPVSSLPNVDSLSNAMAMLTMRARRFLQKTGRNLGANGPTSIGFDMSKVECYNCHRKGQFARECRSPKDSRRNSAAESQRRTVPFETSTSNALVSQCDGVGSYDWSYQAEEEPANYALMAFSSLRSSSDNERVIVKVAPTSLYDRFQPSDGYHVVPPHFTGTFMPPKPDLVFNAAPTAVETDHPTFIVQLSLTKPEQALSHTNRPITPIIEDWVPDSEDAFDTTAPQFVPSFVQSFEQVKSPRHSVRNVETTIPATTPKPASPKPASSGKGRNRKACFVCKSVDHLIKDCDYHAKKMTQPTPRNHTHRGNHKQYATLTPTNPQKHMVLAEVLTQSKPVSITVVRPLVLLCPNSGHSPKTSNSPPGVTAVKTLVVSAAQGNMSYLSDFEELNGGYVSFGGFEDLDYPDKVYKVVKALYDLHQAPKACQDKYVAEILRKFGLTEGKSASTPIDIEKPLLKDPNGEDIDVHTYRLMIGSLMYLTLSRPDIMFAVYACQCKKKTVVATSSTEAEYVAAASCYAQVLWIQNQLLDYGDSPLLGVNTLRSDEDMLELIELTVFLLPKIEKVEIGVNAVDL